MAIGFPLWVGQVRDSMTLPHEVGLNQRQPPEFVLKAIVIRSGIVIGEVGAGRGRYTVQIASRLDPGGTLYANDIDRESLAYLRRRCAGLGLKNVEIVTGTVTETGFPEKAMDLVVMVNVVHCLAEPVTLLKNVSKSLKPDGRMAVVEGNLDKDPSAAGEWFSRAKLMGIFDAAGYALIREDASLPRDNIYLLKRRPNGNHVVADGKIFLGTNNGNPRNTEITGDKGVLMCLRESDGRFLWQAVTDKLDGESDWPEEGICSSPAVEGKRLYYVSNRGELICLDTEGFMDGRNDGPFQDEAYKGPTNADIIWKLDMHKELGVGQLYMAASSPVIWEDLVFVVTPNGRDSSDEKVIAPKAPSFLAVDRNTGKVVWQDNSPGEGILHGQWSSASLGTVDGIQQAIFPGGDGWLYSFNARTGEKLWKFDLNPKDAVWPKTRNYGISTPVFSGGQVFMSVGQDPDHPNGIGHAYCINPALRGDITDSGRVWQYDKIRRSISTAAVADGLVYVADMSGLLHCLEIKTGKPNWTFDMMAPVWGSPLVADGKVYLGDQDGDVAVLRAGPEMKKIAEIDMGNSVYSTPVPANGVLYIMTRSELFAIAGRARGSDR